MPDLDLVPVCRLFVQVGIPIEIGETPAGRKRIVPITGGHVTGDRVAGKILHLGADWQTILSDGTAELDTRYVMETDDGAFVDIRNSGLRVCTPEVQARIANGDLVDPSEYSMVTTPRFETASPEYLWLTNGTFVASCRRQPDSVHVNIFEVIPGQESARQATKPQRMTG